MNEVDAENYAEAIRRGGTAVVMRTQDGRDTQATEILKHHHPVDIEHRVETWHHAGWKEFDPSARPFTVDEIAAERRTYLAAS